jgi:hypothetical protein
MGAVPDGVRNFLFAAETVERRDRDFYGFPAVFAEFYTIAVFGSAMYTCLHRLPLLLFDPNIREIIIVLCERIFCGVQVICSVVVLTC